MTVFAAASLRDVFARLADRFRAEHPATEVRFNFAGSHELRAQIEHGAPADVFASADVKQVAALQSGGLIDPFRVFAHNEPVVIAPVAASSRIRRFADLPRARRLVIGAVEVPIGKYTQEILDRAARVEGPGFKSRVEANVVSRELNVRHVLAKVALGEADAGIVYRTDAASSSRVVSIDIPPALNVFAEYTVARVKRARNPAKAAAWVALLMGPEGQRLLAGAGFRSAQGHPASAQR